MKKDIEKTFDNFVITEKNKEAFQKTKDFLTNDTGLFLFGPVGCGKTHLAQATRYELRKCPEWQEKYPRFVPVPELLLRIRSSFNNYSDETEEMIIDELTHRSEYLFLDDFGAEKISDFSIETIYLILDRRLRLGKWKVFITSNFSLSQLAELTSDRIASRILEMCEIQEIYETDWRLKKKNEEKNL